MSKKPNTLTDEDLERDLEELLDQAAKEMTAEIEKEMDENKDKYDEMKRDCLEAQKMGTIEAAIEYLKKWAPECVSSDGKTVVIQ